MKINDKFGLTQSLRNVYFRMTYIGAYPDKGPDSTSHRL